ncbi:NADH-ubiquinone oxidoreductase-F iron-sulfur binding region domain-containing protein [Eubacterium oxidoreducens]|uniref:NADH-ubiquinone oxidoreductase-F iron-sulfur binding region domain-containing protein n=1 Tax=Eubacterium oxidoreducens TaxID=1732 RepID=UPI0015A21CE6|nr:NADH-ubiquinone oxidoreductase-F iron-sulfur binding region domain-containing protein [Eubacterium oxidoreducens]
MELIPTLMEKQKQNGGYLGEKEILDTACDCNLSVSKVIGIASFYEFFNLKKAGMQTHIERIYEKKTKGNILDFKREDAKKANEIAKEIDVLTLIEKSGLCGRSGSGFPTAKKWEIVRNENEMEKYVVCNADEGEPGTGKDRIILEEVPYSVICGMHICAQIIGAKKGFIYLRGEYEDLKEKIEKTIEEFKSDGFEIIIRLGQGAYICGEETALIESLENKRGEPRLKPPFPGNKGYLGKPTVINNVETFANVPLIVTEHKSYEKTRLFTVCGDVMEPGVYEEKSGISLEQLLIRAGGMENHSKPYAIQIGGGSGNIVSGKFLDLKLSEEETKKINIRIGTGSVYFISDKEKLIKTILERLSFYVKESCGTCVPCRSGLSQLRMLVMKIEEKDFDNDDINKITELIGYIEDNSRCPMARAAVAPLKSVIKNFPEVVGL